MLAGPLALRLPRRLQVASCRYAVDLVAIPLEGSFVSQASSNSTGSALVVGNRSATLIKRCPLCWSDEQETDPGESGEHPSILIVRLFTTTASAWYLFSIVLR